jgi:uncharacterized protein DUF1579
MKTRMALWAVLASLVFLVEHRVNAADEVRPPELKVLDRWVGDWDVDITIKPGASAPQGSKSTYKSVIRWALNDRFIKCEAEGQGVAGDHKFADAFIWICTYDPQARTYKSSVCWSNVEPGQPGSWGITSAGVGTWEEKEQMMTIRSEDRDTGTVSISATQWIDKDTHRFVQSITEKNGRVVVEWTGMAKRKK